MLVACRPEYLAECAYPQHQQLQCKGTMQRYNAQVQHDNYNATVLKLGWVPDFVMMFAGKRCHMQIRKSS